MAGLIPPDKLEQIRAASDIVDVVGAVLPLKRAGANFVALCPFHREKSPSFNVNPSKQIFRCFGCGKGGDVFRFIQEYESIGFMDAVRRLAERAKIPLEFENNPAAQQQRHVKDKLLEVHEQIAQRWQVALANDAGGQIARDYLVKRGVSEEAVKLFRLGYAPEAWDDTVNWAKSKGYDAGLMEQAGLIIKKEGTDRHYDRFRGRLMFPICDEQGRVVAFSGRILSGDEKTAKYVNSPETPIFSKGRIFFGLDKSKRAILDKGFAIICEGQLDLIACYMAGVQNIVAPQGTAFTDNHARILKRYVNEVVLCFDSDNAGQNAVVRVLDSLLGSGLAIKVSIVPAPHDPDSFIKENGAEAFQQMIARAEGFFDWYLGRLCSTNDVASDKGRLNVLRSFGEAINKTGNAVLVDTYAQKAALRLGVGMESVRTEFRKLGRAHTPYQPPPEEIEVPPEVSEDYHGDVEVTEPVTPPTVHERHLLKLLMLGNEIVGAVAARLHPDWIPNPVVRRIVEHSLQAHADEVEHAPAAFLADFGDDPAAYDLLTAEMADNRQMPQPEKQMLDVLKRLRDQYLDRQIAMLRQQMAQPDLDHERKIELLREQQAFGDMKRRPMV